MGVARNTAYNLTGSLAPIVVSLLVLPLYLRTVGTDRYGLLAIFLTISTTLSFLSFGLGPAVTQRIASQKGQTTGRRSELVWTAVSLSLVSAVLGSLLWLALGRLYFDHFAAVPQGLDGEIRGAMPFVATSLGVTLLGAPFVGALQGRHQFLAINVIQVVQSIFASVLPLVVARTVGPELPNLVATSTCISVLGMLSLVLVARRLVPLERPAKPNIAELKALSRYGGWMTLISFLSPLVLIADRLIIGAVRGPAQVAIYAIPYNLVQRLVLLPASFSGAIFPHLAASDNHDEVLLQRQSLDALAAVLTPITLVAIALLHPFLTLWVGSAIATPAHVPGIILAFGFWIHGVAHVPSTILMGRGNLKPIAGILLFSAAPYLALVYFLTVKLGILGAALAWLGRAMLDALLFLWTSPPRDASIRVLAAAALVMAMMASAIFADHGDVGMWLLKAAIIGVALLIYRDFWSGLLAQFLRRKSA